MPKFRLKQFTYNSRQVKEQKEKLQEHGNMVIVHGRDMDSLNDALRRFRKKVDDSGVMDDWHKASYYVKPSKRKREKRYAHAKQARIDSRIHRNRQSETNNGW